MSAGSLRGTGGRGADALGGYAVLHLDKLHAKHLLPGFTDRTLEEREIDAVATDITRVRLPPQLAPS